MCIDDVSVSRKSADCSVQYIVIVLLPWLRFLLRAGIFLVSIVLMMVVVSIVLCVIIISIIGSVGCSDCL